MMLSHIYGLFAHPNEQWRRIRAQNCTVGKCYCSYLFILAAIPPVAGYFGTTMFGWEIGGRDPIKLSHDSALMIALAYYLVMLVGVFSVGFMIHWMGKTYGTVQPLPRCMSLAAYVATPMFLVGIFELLPVLWLNFVIALPALAYSVYLLYTGVPVMMEIPEERGFLFSSAVLAVGLVALVSVLAATAILWGSGFAPQFVD